MTDDKITNCFVLSYHAFLHPINYLLSPAALSLSYFHSQLLSLKKQDSKNFYSSTSLPRVTYLNLTGIYSEIDIDIINEFSANVQTIMIYDENTGGPSILTKGFHAPDNDMRSSSKHFHQISEKLLLIPLKCNQNQQKKSYNQNDILNIIESFVVRAIANFKPSYIVLNCSLIFDETNNTPFVIDEKALSQIIHKLNQLSDNKILIYPWKLPDMKINENKRLFNESLSFVKNEEQLERISYIFDQYAVAYNEEFLRDSFFNIIETLAELKEFNDWQRANTRKRFGASRLSAEMLSRLTKHYKNHPYYNFLYSKTPKILTQISKNEEKFRMRSSMNQNPKVSGKLLLLNEDKYIKSLKLKVQDNKTDEIILDENSQYLIDYGNCKDPMVFIFNARLCKDFFMDRNYGNLVHLAFKYNLEESSQNVRIIHQFDLDKIENRTKVKDFGLVNCGNFVFEVYGTLIGESKDTNDINCYDFKNGKHYKIKVKDETPEILPRHAVTACAFQREGIYYLYIFGGKVQEDTIYKDQELGKLHVIDFVEVYSTDDPTKPEWNYKIITGDQLLNNTTQKFVHFKHSFAHYNEETDQIFLMGGSGPKNSVHDWTFPVFKFNVKKEKFVHSEIFLNEMKGFNKRKSIQGDEAKQVIPVAIADINKNYSHNKQENTFKFLVPCQDEKDLVCVYSYNYKTHKCDFDQIMIPNETEGVCISPPNLKAEDRKPAYIPINKSREVLYLIKAMSLIQRKFTVEIIEGLISLNQGEFSVQDLEAYLNRLHENLRGSLRMDDKDMLIEAEEANKKIYILRTISNFMKKEGNPEMFLDRRGLIEIKEFLIVHISAYDSSWSSSNRTYPIDDDNISQMSFTVSDSEATMERTGEIKKKLFSPLVLEDPNGSLQKENLQLKSDRSPSRVQRQSSNDSYSIIQGSPRSPIEKMASISHFKECIATAQDFRAFINYFYNGITVISQNDNELKSRDFRFKVIVDDELEDISFYLTPSSLSIYRGALVCYIDQEFKKSHPHIFKKYKYCVLYASIGDALALPTTGKASKYIVFKKLFTGSGDEPIFNRCLLMNQESLFLIGGKSVKFKGKGSIDHHNFIRYQITKLNESITQNESEIKDVKDTQVDHMEKCKGKCVAVLNEEFMFICQEEDPEYLEIFNLDGTFEECVELPAQKGVSVHLNLVHFQDKEQILISSYTTNQNMTFLLYNIKKKSWEKNITLSPEKEELRLPLLYSRNEVLEKNIDERPLKDMLIYNYREEQPKVIKYHLVTNK